MGKRKSVAEPSTAEDPADEAAEAEQPDEPEQHDGRERTDASTGAEEPVSQSGARPAGGISPEAAELLLSLARTRSRPRVWVWQDLLPGISVISLFALAGIGLGWIWSRLAPPVMGLASDGGVAPLPSESSHQFDAVAMFVLGTVILGAVGGILVWLVRARRGPIILLAAVLGGALAAWLGMRTGNGFAQGRYGSGPGDAASGTLVQVAPDLAPLAVIVVCPLAVALAYGAAVAWCGLQDLGRRRG